MKERPILFSGPMVRAILEGRKTQTRRVVKPQPVPYGEASPYAIATQREHIGKPWMPVGGVFQDRWECPFGVPGDRLWVRETWQSDPCGEFGLCYAATGHNEKCRIHGHAWRPSIHMPRWASRLKLEITAVRVERLQDITEEDAKAEGTESVQFYNERFWKAYGHNPLPGGGELVATRDAKRSFQTLWDSIYGNWTANPDVWVVEFRRVEGGAA